VSIRFKLNRRGVGEILKSDQVELALFVIADKIKDACDPDGHLGEDAYVAVSGKGRTRARASVIAVTRYARNSNAKHNTLVRALDSGRG
jgi:hypothetical protein